MQGGFIGKLKQGYKSIKQEFKGADINNVSLLNNVSNIYDKNLYSNINLYNADFLIKTDVFDKKFIHTYETKNLLVLKNSTNIYNKEIKNDIKIINFSLAELKEDKKEVNSIENYSKFDVIILEKKSEEFQTDVLYESVEKIPKVKIKGKIEKGFKIKARDGLEKALTIPKIYYGRSYIGKKEMLDIAVKVKESRPDFDFKRFKFNAIFYNLPVSHMKKFKYIEEKKELKFYFDSKSKGQLSNMKLVIWYDSSGTKNEKIFV